MKKTNNEPTTVYEPFQVVEKDRERAVKYYRLEDDLKRLSGKVLTIVDTSITDERQNKAMKDLIKGLFSKEIYHYQDICFYKRQGQSVELD